MEFSDIEGKTIKEANHKKMKHYDDTGYLELVFTDNTSCIIVSNYGDYTSNSEGEYPTLIDIENEIDGLENID